MAKGDPLVRQQPAREMEELYRQYRAPMFRVAMSILRDEGLAEDAVQQAFLKAVLKQTLQEHRHRPLPPAGTGKRHLL